ncbi:protein kinase, putative [Phytophthora infestans T30-4]|uniref:Protein kinase, putative n=1 Tax=Phytophthora infestans (strain T30-4) TaxID=403677 RepID=D0N902_PHYIT|nr:protein kinase, putative [Phytophthora infestans T30-4]EEY54037.1 protein kinase, putative [Phytophthora infestans T30-4]|eukprot:XP_002904668.1 protein kinase, putative [Phytophthora infestans T30-4]
MVAPLCLVGRLTVVGLLYLIARNRGVYAACAGGPTTLTTADCTGCGDYDLCVGYMSASSCSGSGCETDGVCTYKCMRVDKNSEKLVVLVGFGTYKSEEELAAGGYTQSDLAGYPDETSSWPSVSNDDVTALGRISVSSAVTTFIATGGTTAMEYPKGKVSNIILSSNVISSATSVTTVGLTNLALKNQIDTLPAFVPASVESLDLSNTLLSTFPAKLSSLQVLKELVLDNNYVTSVDATNGIDSITTLSMQNNNLANFSAVFSKVEKLYLGGNNLTSIPSAVYSYSSLKTLNLTGNPLASREFTSKQANFLNSLETLGLSTSDFSTDLDCSREGKIVNVPVCITDDGSLTTSATTNGGTVSSSSAASDGSTTTTTTESSSSTSSMSWIVGIVCGVFVVLFAAFIFVLHRRKEHKKMDVSIASDTVGYSDHYSSTNNWHQLLQSRGRGSSFEDIPMVRLSSDVSMGIPTLTNEQHEMDNTEVAVVDATAVSSIPSFVSTEEAVSKGKPQRFMSIWNDLELLSLQLRASAIKDLKPLGSGAYATVWLVRYRNLQLLASKRLRPERRTKKHTAAFVEEIKLIANFDHPNLVRLIGAAWTVETDLQMLLEYMEGGDLRRYLADSNTPSGWTTTKFNIAIDVIEALVYLHSFTPPLVHRDLKSNNVLLSSDMEAKLSDFGTSRFRSSDKTMTGGVGTGRWLAPEVIRGDSDYGPAADIYSFGTLLTELDTNQIPYDNVRASNGKIMSDLTILHRVATGKLHPKVRATCGKALKDLVERCLLEDPAERPTAPAIAYELRVIQQEM